MSQKKGMSMKKAIVVGNIMKCNEKKVTEGKDGFCDYNKESSFVPDELIKKAVLIRWSEEKFIDVSEIFTGLDIIFKLISNKALTPYPKEVGDYYVDATSIKSYYNKPVVDISIAKIKRDIKKIDKKQKVKTI